MTAQSDDAHAEIRDAVRRLCADFPGAYWQALDRERAYPTAFVQALTAAGFLSVLIPEEYGGSGLGLGAATVVLEEIHRSGCNGGACHAQMYTMGTLLKHGSAAQKQTYRSGFRPSVSPSPMRAPIPRASGPSPGATATITS
jgi:alkylation response protein AidB-like acyl-CoA dehydrogenase